MNAPTENALVQREYPIFAMPREQAISVLTNSLYPGAKPESVGMVLAYCMAAGLDPMDKPVHIVPMPVSTGRKDNDGWDIMETRDVVMQGVGLHRTKAARTGQYAGQDEPIYGPDKTDTLDGVSITYPEWCKVTVYRLVDGKHVGWTALERWTENYATKSRKSSAPNAMWKKRPYGQLAKCAEAQALRKAFPDAIGAEPTAEEMEGKQTFDFDLGPGGAVTPTPPPPPAAPTWPDDKFAPQFARWAKAVEQGLKTPADILALARSKGALTPAQTAAIEALKVSDPARQAGSQPLDDPFVDAIVAAEGKQA